MMSVSTPDAAGGGDAVLGEADGAPFVGGATASGEQTALSST